MTTVERPPSNPPGATGGWDRLREEFLRSGDAAPVLSGRTAMVDAVVADAFSAVMTPVAPRGVAALAVGGYGRRELFPYSDVDLLLLAGDGRLTPTVRQAFSAFLQTLWDKGLRLSQSVHSAAECCQLDDGNIELSISLLDARFLAGDEEIYSKLAARLPRFFETHKEALVRSLCRMLRERHAPFHDTIYQLEPNVKEGPGGLRDLHTLHWMDKLRGPGAPEPLAKGLDAPRAFLHSVRTFLHYRSARDNNILSFDAQEEIIEQAFLPFERPEHWMREYFRHTRAIHKAAIRAVEAAEGKGSSLLAGFRDWRGRLSNSDFTVSRERVYLKSPHGLESDPGLVWRLFAFLGRHGLRLSADAERRVEEYAPTLAERCRRPQPLWPALKEILSMPRAALALRAMHETGVLKAVFPEWGEVECCVVRDFYHRYTVDEHSLVAIENLEELERASDPQRARFAGLLGELDEPALLRMALVFHDTGKGEVEGSHVDGSVQAARPALERIQMPPAGRQEVCALIAKHLDLSSAMTGRDLDDPVTARFLASRVGTIEQLKALTLLTYADIGAVNSTALTSWRLDQLWRVYVITERELTRELDTDRIQSPLPGSPEKEGFLKGLPVRYLRTHTDAEIERHLELDRQRRQSEVAIEIARAGGVFRLTVLCKDRLHLFASVAGALASFGMNILKAEAFANQQGTVLDTFVFADPRRTLELNPTEIDRLQLTLERVLLGRVQVKDLLKFRPRPEAPSRKSGIAPRVAFDNNASDTATLVEIAAQDRPGLLYDVASAFSAAGCSIEVVMVDTEAHRALDVFYVTRSGRKLDERALESLRDSLLRACQG